MKNNRKNTLADFGLLYAALIWGLSFTIVKSIIGEIDPVVLVGYRFLLAGLILLSYLLIKGQKILVDLKRTFCLSLILWMLHLPMTLGLKFTTASNSGFITGLFVAFIPIFLKIFFKRRPALLGWFASILSLAGLWILTGGMNDINNGDLITLITAMAYALHVLLSDKYMKEGVDPILISCQQFIIVGILSLITAVLFNIPFTVGSTKAGLVILFLVLFPTIAAFVIQMFAQKIRPPLRVSLIFATQPVFAALFAWTIGGEIFILHRALGGLLIFLALIIYGFASSRE